MGQSSVVTQESGLFTHLGSRATIPEVEQGTASAVLLQVTPDQCQHQA